LGWLICSPFFKDCVPCRQPETVLEIKLCVLHRFVAKDKVTRGVERVVEKGVILSQNGRPVSVSTIPVTVLQPSDELGAREWLKRLPPQSLAFWFVLVRLCQFQAGNTFARHSLGYCPN
jgi:hypothetical protein